MSQSELDTTTAVDPRGAGAYSARMDRGWWVGRGPNGGYVAAVILRALMLELDDPARVPRSLTVHFAAPPQEGAVRMETRVERRGRSVATLSARMLQGERLVAMALAAFSTAWPGTHDFAELRPPVVPAPDRLDPPPRDRPVPPVAERFEFRHALGPAPFSGGDRALAGGWIRLADPRPVDALAVAAMSDGWLPAAFARLTQPAMLPTIDLTVHFRASLPLQPAGAGEWTLAAFRSRYAREGFVEEDGELWSRQGVLLAQSRQLALII